MDVPLLLAAVCANSPCGEDLEYDAQFLQLERDAQGKPERSMGDSVQPAEPPAWRAIEQSSTALLQRSKDLRITHFLTQSALALEGFAGLNDALNLINQLLQQYWLELYPLLDADDDNDPTVRVNALSGLACETNVRLLRESVLTRSRAFGTVTLRAALNASGLQSFADESLNADELGGALRDSDPQQLAAMHRILTEARGALDAIERFVSEQVGSAQGVDLSALRQPLKLALQVLAEYAPGSAGESQADTTASAAETAEHPPVDAPAVAAPRATGEIGNRDEVLRSLDRILAYYTRHEPSSPLPVLLNRAKNLVHADFAAIVRNLIPDGMSQFENLRGPEGE
ncbi:type VI secretion system protein TssA [Pseudomonas gingeri]|uniref:type VI secretion system protein TssA n=1 Tax=Pseudomonas gingeri TaxID=117681 RepID=UPI0015A03745|nr:type VI secretion system protein TssA [Pseudomonas gingeri]NWA04925.1 type VI secretion system protein TssA [Pseudomonas gingeri]NWA17453.1 type VI secretion system protein TssA [Pseudomonas gingeri]NWA58708.1 type VI secretion system protein TssA [Pseudomonas gingeri]NWA96987.1 type VI secretion system protein TssA [Pseudomonas gingeri]NWB05481.1 type VI secretion system protein TssA [Pseudomonas gingeri]